VKSTDRLRIVRMKAESTRVTGVAPAAAADPSTEQK
jgi:hypothetical protein